DFEFGEDIFTVLEYTMIDIDGTQYFIYLVKGTGIYFGQNKADITTAIVLDEKGIVVDAYFTDYGHSETIRDLQLKQAMIAYLNHLVMNSKDIKTFLTSDVFDGSSGATNSFKVVKNIFYALRLYVNDEVAISEGTVLTKTTKVVDGKTLITYQVYGYGAYRFNSDGSVRDEGAVITNITIDENNVIVATEFVVYEHTSGSFKDKSQAFIESLVTNDQNILDFKLEDEFDGSADSTNSFNVIRESIFGLTTYLKNGNK
ncbi:MAG TPA: hypothetical protein VJ845_01650, partial [Haploplasma sp.]|nr:hypothetical protein [Haploplasma sp.]